eukprot:366301-Chlamydomonas_euryale.AAC.21
MAQRCGTGQLFTGQRCVYTTCAWRPDQYTGTSMSVNTTTAAFATCAMLLTASLGCIAWLRRHSSKPPTVAEHPAAACTPCALSPNQNIIWCCPSFRRLQITSTVGTGKRSRAFDDHLKTADLNWECGDVTIGPVRPL